MSEPSSPSSRGFGYWLAIFANLAVVGGIVFLGVEIRQNSQLMKAQIRNEITQNVFTMIEMSLRPEVIDARVRRASGEEPLPGDQFLFNGVTRGIFRSFENTEYQYRMGLFDQAEYQANLIFIEGLVQNPTSAEWWDQNREQFSERLQQVLDSLIARQR